MKNKRGNFLRLILLLGIFYGVNILYTRALPYINLTQVSIKNKFFADLKLSNTRTAGVGGLSYNINDDNNLIENLVIENAAYTQSYDDIENSSGLAITLGDDIDVDNLSDTSGDDILSSEVFLRAPVLMNSSYKVKQGDMVSILAEKWGLNQSTIISMNSIKQTRYLQIGQMLKVPNQDGILYTSKTNDTLDSIAEKYKISKEEIISANELFGDDIRIGAPLFIPGAKINQTELQEINGDLFIWPVSVRRITSSYGYRADPFGKKGRSFHTGLDIGVPYGTPVKAAMSGRIVTTNWSDVYGNYVVIAHHSNYRTLYGHLSSISVKAGTYVNAGQTIARSGSSGLSTGPHLHFTVYKNGATTNPRALMN